MMPSHDTPFPQHGFSELMVTFQGDTIVLQKPLVFVPDEETCIVVPKGFECDGSSVPRLVWAIVGHPKHGKNVRPGVLHDWLVTPSPITGRLPVSRERAAKLFRHALKLEGKTQLGRLVMYVYVACDAVVRRIASWFGHGKEYA